MPWDFVDVLQPTSTLQFVTFSCCDRLPLLNTPVARERFEQCLEKTQRMYRLELHGYVVMPEHVHLLVLEPERYPLSIVVQTLKQIAARALNTSEQTFWMQGYQSACVATERKRVEYLQTMHGNAVKRGLVSSPEAWPWSSYGKAAYASAVTRKQPVVARAAGSAAIQHNLA